MQKLIINHIRKFVNLTDDEIPVLLKYLKLQSVKKRDYLLNEGQICKSMYFVEKGCLRMYFLNNKSAEQITQFAIEGWWISDYFGFNDHKVSEYYIQAIEKSEVYILDKQIINDLFAELPQMERYFRIVMQKTVAASQLRIKHLYDLSKEELYNHFSVSFPEFMQRVPQYMIASYLGLTPEYVSELRKKKS
ncbi:MAG: Crp/Fnr family transcriptional regulator [Bacteroidota bacterium]